MNNKEVLPIGTVVIAGDKEVPIMIVGYGAEENGIIYDYACFLFPLGIDDNGRTILINSNQIKEIVFTGYKYNNFEEFAKIVQNIKKDE